MTISNNGYDCSEMYEQACRPVLEAVRMGSAQYVCKVCGALTAGEWPEPAVDPITQYYTDRNNSGLAAKAP